jgi:nitrous oxidase accessory protein
MSRTTTNYRDAKSAEKGRTGRIAALAGLCWALIVVSGSAATVRVVGSISQAISNALDGDTVLVQGPGVFHERIVIGKAVHLVGSNSPVIDGGGSGTPLTASAPAVTVSGMIIRNSGRDLTAFNSGIMITSSDVSIQNCRIENDGFGIYLRGVNDCVIEGNEIIGSKQVASAARGNGIHVWKAQRNGIVGNTIRDKRDGMYFSYADNNVIAGNDIENTRFGIHYMYSHENRLLTNSLTHNVVGATLMFSRKSLIEGNHVYANQRHGFVLKQFDSSRVVGNIVAGQNRGFFVQQANQNRFEGNIIATNDIGLYFGSRRLKPSKGGKGQTAFRKKAGGIIGAITPVWTATMMGLATPLITRRMCLDISWTGILKRAYLR